LRQYELVVVVRPDPEDTRVVGTIERIEQFVKSRGGEVTSVDKWGRRRLAYPIQKVFEGDYFIARLSLDGAATRDLEASLAISEDVLRHLLVRLDN
jgi:small subunit ribosomal protein S6